MRREARRIYRELTPEEQARLERARAQVAEELPDLIRRDQLRKTASEEDTLSGALRRAIHTGGLTLTEVADRVGVSVTEIDDFLTGEGTLQSDVIDRLVEVFGLKLAIPSTSK